MVTLSIGLILYTAILLPIHWLTHSSTFLHFNYFVYKFGRRREDILGKYDERKEEEMGGEKGRYPLLYFDIFKIVMNEKEVDTRYISLPLFN